MKANEEKEGEAFQPEFLEEYENTEEISLKFEKLQLQRITIPSKDFSTSSFKSLHCFEHKQSFSEQNNQEIFGKKPKIISVRCIQPNFFAEFLYKKQTKRQFANSVREKLLSCAFNPQKTKN